jgi:ElaB/YqjD/DUF883 family membrane-anchored ribosome-binding protein
MATKSTKSEPAGAGGEERSPEQIEAEIEATRQEVGKTAAELADKADVKKQAKDKVAETKAKAAAKGDEVKEKASAQKEKLATKVNEATSMSMQDAAQQAAQVARENPVASVAFGGFACGLLVGWILARG